MEGWGGGEGGGFGAVVRIKHRLSGAFPSVSADVPHQGLSQRFRRTGSGGAERRILRAQRRLMGAKRKKTLLSQNGSFLEKKMYVVPGRLLKNGKVIIERASL